MDRRRPSVLAALRLVVAVWCVLALVQSAVPGCMGVALSFAGALALVESARRADASRPSTGVAAHLMKEPRQPPSIGHTTRNAFALGAYAAGGVVLHPWVGLATIRAIELAGGRAPIVAPRPELCGWELASLLVLAPLFEERLYRERLVPALQRRRGAPIAIVASAGCFALPHLTPVRVLGTFFAGLVLGALWCTRRRAAPCVAMHAGLNAAALSQHTGLDAAALWLHAAIAAS